MDLSKLPKLSDTQSQVPDPGKPPGGIPSHVEAVAYQPMAQRPPGIGGEIWISLIVGIILAYMGGTFGRFAIAKLTHQPFHTGVNWNSGPKEGTEVTYFELQGYTAWTDMGVYLFGMTLLFEAAAKTLLMLKPGKLSVALLMLAVLLTLSAVVLNIIACWLLFGIGITPLISGLAVAFGGWILFDEFTTLQRIRNPGFVSSAR